MAYLITNASLCSVNISGAGPSLQPGQSRSVTEIGTTDLLLQERGVIKICRLVPDSNKDDARFVEIINNPLVTAVDQVNEETLRPSTPTILNVAVPFRNQWVLVSDAVPGVLAWKLQLRRMRRLFAFHYAYVSPQSTFMTCAPGEAVTADTRFPSIYVRVPAADGQVVEFEYWVRAL